MPLVECPECQNEISELAPTCPRCGAVRKRGRGCLGWIGLLALVLLVVFILFIAIGVYAVRHTASSALKPVSVIYKVNGTARSASLTYNNEQGGTQQRRVVLPWEESFVMRPGAFLYISAQNQNDHGSLTVTITVDGKQYRSSYSSGPYTIASASGRCCE
jgi:hypothetical protein